MAVVCRNTEPPAPVQRHPAVHQESECIRKDTTET